MFVKGYSYNDILLVPRFSEVRSRSRVNLESHLTPKITLKMPIISSNMDTVTESEMAITMAKNGGLGIIHRYCTIEEQVDMVKRVKRATNYIVEHPFTCSPDTTVEEAKKIMNENKIGCLLVISYDNTSNSDLSKAFLVGIMTRRDLQKVLLFNESDRVSLTVNQIMPTNLYKFDIDKHGLNNELMLKICLEHAIENLPLVNSINQIRGLVTLKDLMSFQNGESMSLLDSKGRLICGAAIGVHGDYQERAEALINAGCDILCIDVAHGHHLLCGDAVKLVKDRFPDTEIIAGNVATPEGVEYLAKCGTNSVKIGVGNGGICITRGQTGCGYPQFSAVLECSQKARELGISIIADGGHKGSCGNLVKALAAGANACMLGGMLAGTSESPGLTVVRDGQKCKIIRGMAGRLANLSRHVKTQDDRDLVNMTPEGVEGYIPFKGEVSGVLEQFKGGIRSGLSYQGCHQINELHDLLAKGELKFAVMTSSGRAESGSHGITPL